MVTVGGIFTWTCVLFLRLMFWSTFCSIKPFSPFSFLQGNQEPAATPDAMVQPFTTIPFPPPPQNGIPTEYGVPHTQDYAGQTSEHNLTLYGSTQPHGEQSTNTASTQNGSLAVSAQGCPARTAQCFGEKQPLITLLLLKPALDLRELKKQNVASDLALLGFPFLHVPLVNWCLRRAVVLEIVITVVLPWWHCPKTVSYKSVNYFVLIGKWFK